MRSSRAGVFAALAILCPFRLCHRRRQILPARRSQGSSGQARRRDQGAGRAGRQAGRAAAPRTRCRFPEERLSQRHGAARARSWRPRPTIRQPGCALRAPSCRSARATIASARSCSNAPLPPPISPIPAPATAARRRTRSPSSAAALPIGKSGVPRSTAIGWRSTCAKSPMRARNMSGCATSTASACSTIRSTPIRLRRAPASSFPRSYRPNAPDFSPFVSVPGIDKPALSASEKQLCVEGLKHGERYTRHAARRSAFGGQGDARQVGGFHGLCARPQTVGALHRQGLCAAAHRPARHSDREREYRRCCGRNLPHRRPQPDRHGAGRGLPAQSRSLCARAARSRTAACGSGRASWRSSSRSTPK